MARRGVIVANRFWRENRSSIQRAENEISKKHTTFVNIPKLTDKHRSSIHMPSLGTLVPERPCDEFYATRRQFTEV